MQNMTASPTRSTLGADRQSSTHFPRLNRSQSLSWWITLPFVLLLLVSISLVGSLITHQGSQATQQLAYQIEQALGDRVSEQLTTWFKTPVAINQLNRNNRLDLDRPDEIRRRFLIQLSSFPQLHQLMVADPQGRSLRLTKLPDHYYRQQTTTIGPNARPILTQQILDSNGQILVTEPTDMVPAIDQDPRQFDWYRGAIKAQKRTWITAPKTGIAIATEPILTNQAVQQVIAAAMDLTAMDQFVNSLQISPKNTVNIGVNSNPNSAKSQIFVIDQSGALLLTSTPESAYQASPNGPIAIDARDSKNPITQASAQLIYAQWNSMSPTQITPMSLGVGGEILSVQARRYSPYAGADWAIVVVIPEADILGPIHSQQQQTLWLCLGLLLLSLLLCRQLAQWLVRPIRRLNQAARSLSQGQWDFSPTLPLDRRDELGDLAQSFADMGQDLRHSFQQLEQQAQQLDRQNQTLSDQNKRLEDLDRLKDEFLANTSHELRTPLSGILGLAESIQAQTATDVNPAHQDAIELIILSSRRLGNLINDILDLSKLNHNALQVDCQPIALHPIVQHVLQICAPLAEPQQLELINNIPTDLPLAYADSHRLQQILYNLIGNAIKFTPQGRITITAKTSLQSTGIEQLSITIADTGIGIEPEQQQRIFNAFEQGNGQTTRIYGGTGLGLAIVKTFVELQGGQVDVQSQPGQGSQFRFTLPIAPAGSSPTDLQLDSTVTPFRPALARRSPQSTHPLPPESSLSTIPVRATSVVKHHTREARILIVDDDLINLQVLRSQLRSEPYEIIEASSGEQALQLLSPQQGGDRFDLIILDVMMPLLSGYDVCRNLRQIYPSYKLPVVMLTAKVQIQDVVEGFRAGANDYLKKPFSRDELKSRIQTHLSNRIYGRFVPQHFLQFLQKTSIADITLGNHVSRDMTVMFSDIRGFATISETMTPQENFDFINDYLQRVSPEIRINQGFIVKYLGDGMMAIFPRRVEDAIAAGIAKLHQVHQLNRDRYGDRGGHGSIAIGIGIHYGPMMVGIVGENQRMQCDAFSDNVNLAARIEGLTKFYGVSMIISEQVLQQLGSNPSYQIRKLGQVLVQGRQQPFMIYEIFDADPIELRHQKAVTLSQFELGVEAYQTEQFIEAQIYFQRVLQQSPDDRPAQLYCNWIADRLSQSKPAQRQTVAVWDQK
jgi:signal transduction histidine kinase/class 3 adenylate cyclase/ActR/RegA family two-component response regulator